MGSGLVDRDTVRQCCQQAVNRLSGSCQQCAPLACHVTLSLRCSWNACTKPVRAALCRALGVAVEAGRMLYIWQRLESPYLDTPAPAQAAAPAYQQPRSLALSGPGPAAAAAGANYATVGRGGNSAAHMQASSQVAASCFRQERLCHLWKSKKSRFIREQCGHWLYRCQQYW